MFGTDFTGRGIGQGVAGACLRLLLWGCICASPAAARPDPSGRLRWMGHWKGEGARETLVCEVLDEFRFLHPELAIDFRFSADVLPQKSQAAAANYLVEMIRTGNLEWDVVWLDSLIYGMVADQLDDWDWGRKHLVDFSAGPGFEKTQKEFLVQGDGTHAYTAGFFSGPYIEGFFYTAWYNKAVAGRLGIEIREEGMTEQDLLGYVEKVHAYNQTADQPIAAFLDVARSGSMSRLYYAFLCSRIPGCVPDKAFDEAAREEAYARTEDYFAQLGRFRPLAGNGSSREWPAAADFMLNQNRALFFFDASWRYTAFKAACPEQMDRLRLAQMPGFDGNCHAIGGYIATWAVLKNAPGRDAGIELMRFWSRPPIAQKWVRCTKCPTGLKGDLYDPTFGQDIFAEYQRKLLETCRQPIPALPVHPMKYVKQWPDFDLRRSGGAIRALRGEGAE